MRFSDYLTWYFEGLVEGSDKGRKIFISYKYGDSNVAPLSRNNPRQATTVRDYVDKFQSIIENTGNHINKGEKDGEDLSEFANSTIKSKLREKIFDSSVTVVFISPNMKDTSKREQDQWIPWEISYSLREPTRTTQTGTSRKSRINGIVAVVLPDKDREYDYFIVGQLGEAGHRGKSYIIKPKVVFDIILRNINLENKRYCPVYREYKSCFSVYHEKGSYIEIVKWDDFIKDINSYIEKAISRSQNNRSYKITKMPYVLK